MFCMTWTTLAALADSVHFKLVNGRYTSSSVADKNFANVGLDVDTNQGDNDTIRPTGRTCTSSNSSLQS